MIRTSASRSATVTRSPGFFSAIWSSVRVRNRGLTTSSATSRSRVSTSSVSTPRTYSAPGRDGHRLRFLSDGVSVGGVTSAIGRENSQATTVGELRESGHVQKSLREEVRDNLLGKLRVRRGPVAGAARLRRHGHPAAGAGAARRPRRRAARRARTGQDPAAAHAGGAARRVDARDRGQRAGRAPLRPDHPGVTAPRHRAGRPAARRLAAPRGAVRREARHPRHQRRRPDRRRGPDEGGRGPQPRRPRDHPLRPGPAQPPGDRRDQRAARPRRADPGGAAQRDGGARHPDPRLRAAAAPRRAAVRQRQPRGLHQPRAHHHPAQGPVRRGDPHPLPRGARGRDRRRPPGGTPAGRGAGLPGRDPGAVHPQPA